MHFGREMQNILVCIQGVQDKVVTIRKWEITRDVEKIKLEPFHILLYLYKIFFSIWPPTLVL